MKKIKYLLFGLILLFLTTTVYAIPQYSVSVNKKSIQVGQSVTVTVSISNSATWNVHITSAGSTNGCSNAWADSTADASNTKKSFTTTCKGTSTGTISFVVSGDITDADGNNHEISESLTVNVTEAVVEEKSTVNSLSSLSVDDAELVPDFDPNVLEYSASLPAGTTSAYIRVLRKDTRSIASGWGDVKVEEGANRFEIKVKAENGSVKTYVVVINVASEEAITVNVDGKDYTLVRNKKNLETPNGFTDTTVSIDGQEIPAFYHEKANIVLVGLKDSDGNTNLYVYDEDNKSYSLFDSIEVKGVMFLIMTPSEKLDEYDKEKTIRIGEKDYTVYYKDNEDIVLVYGMNLETGNTGWYQYDTKEETLQRYVAEKKEEKKTKDYFLLTILFATGFGLSLLVLLILLASNGSKDKKNEKLVSMLEKKMDEEKNLDSKPKLKKKKVVEEEEDEDTKQMDLKFLEFIDQEAENARAQGNDDALEDTASDLDVTESTLELTGTDLDVTQEVEAPQGEKKLSSKEFRAIMKAKKKAEKEAARKMREDFLATREIPTVKEDKTSDNTSSISLKNSKKKNSKVNKTKKK